MIYYIADTNFRDQSIFDKCKRPFKSLLDMDEAIINNWNKRVKDDDVIYVLGDLVIDKNRKVCVCHYPFKGGKQR